MSEPRTIFTLVGFLVLVQLCNSQNELSDGFRKEGMTSTNRNGKTPLEVLKKISNSLTRINNILTFKMLDDENRRLNFGNQLAKSVVRSNKIFHSERRKCRLDNLLFGTPCANDEKPKMLLGSEKINSERYLPFNSETDSNIEADSKKLRSHRLNKNMYKKSGHRKRNPGKYDDEILNDEAVNDEDGLNALNDDDNGPGALNDDIDGPPGLNNDANEFNDDVEENFNDDSDGFAALNDDDDGPGALNDEDQFADEDE